MVVADIRSPRDGAFVEIIGHYNPLTDPATIDINEEKALKWLNCGAQPTDTVRSLLRRCGIMDKFKSRKETTHSTAPSKGEELNEGDKETK